MYRSVIVTFAFATHILCHTSSYNLFYRLHCLCNFIHIITNYASANSVKPRTGLVDSNHIVIIRFMSNTYFTTGFRNGLMISVYALPHYSWGGMFTLSFINCQICKPSSLLSRTAPITCFARYRWGAGGNFAGKALPRTSPLERSNVLERIRTYWFRIGTVLTLFDTNL